MCEMKVKFRMNFLAVFETILIAVQFILSLRCGLHVRVDERETAKHTYKAVFRLRYNGME
jgi:hypothetical protein